MAAPLGPAHPSIAFTRATSSPRGTSASRFAAPSRRSLSLIAPASRSREPYEDRERHARAVGVLELLAELVVAAVDLDLEARGAQLGRDPRVVERERAARLRARAPRAIARRSAVDRCRARELREQPRRADRDADARQLALRVVLGEVVVAAARADRAEPRVIGQERLVDRAGVVVEAAHDREVDSSAVAGTPSASVSRRPRRARRGPR